MPREVITNYYLIDTRTVQKSNNEIQANRVRRPLLAFWSTFFLCFRILPISAQCLECSMYTLNKFLIISDHNSMFNKSNI